MRRSIFIHYETKVREYDGKILLISHLLEHFDKIYFGSFSGIQREALFNYNGIIIFKSLSKFSVSFYQELKRRNFIIVLLHAEGGFYYKENQATIQSLYNSELLEYVDFHFVFGNAIRNDILKYCGNKFSEKTFVSGEPRFDLLKPAYRSFFSNIISEIKRQHGDFILINTDFSLVNSYAGNTRLFEYLMTEPTYSEDFRMKIIRKSEILNKVIISFVEAIKYLAVCFPNISFIIRPHPSEDEQYYINKFDSFQNVVVSKEHNVASWILAAKGVIHYDCTTGMEAALAQKPVISFLPEKDDDLLVWLPVELSKKVYSKECLSNEVKNILMGTFNNIIDDSTMKAWEEVVQNIKSESSEIIISTIIEKIKDKKYLNQKRYNHTLMLLIKRLRFDLSFIKSRLFLKRIDVDQQKFGYLNKKEVSYKIKHLNKLIKASTYDFFVTKPVNDVIIIKKRRILCSKQELRK